MRKLLVYVSAIVTAALTSGIVVYLVGAPATSEATTSLAVLCFLAVVAEWLGFMLPRSASVSISFIPFLASVIVVPSWPTVVAALVTKYVLEAAAGRALIKRVFNTAGYVLSQAVAIIVFLALGGTSMLSHHGLTLWQLSRILGVPAIAAFSSAVLVNSAVVSGAIALSTNKRFAEIWRENHLNTLAIDIAAGPLVFVFAWVYASFGAIAAAALWVPILGLRQVYKTNTELQRTNEELLQLMVKSIEARDPYTSGHSRRVQHYAVAIARLIGLGEREIERVSRAALLHDVGKIYEKYAPILRKADRLTPEEWATMQEHPVDGANLVATMSGLHDVVPGVRHHHERWDGAGYPDRLSGEAIPLESRIIMFGDTIDAMTSERPYRRPLDEEQVRAELLKCRGKQFDPEITDRLLASPLWSTLFEPAPRTYGVKNGLWLVVTGEHQTTRAS